jgi:ketosteroid isomerase-like protein
MTRSVTASTLVAAATAIAALIWGYRVLFPTDEQRIRGELADLVDAANETLVDEPVARLAAAARIGRHFTDAVVVEFGEPYGRIDGRQAVIAFAGRGRGSDARIGIENVRISVADVTATVTLTVTFTEPKPDGPPATAARDVTLLMNLVGDRWLIARASIVAESESRVSGDRSSHLLRGLTVRLDHQAQRVAFGRTRGPAVGTDPIHR